MILVYYFTLILFLNRCDRQTNTYFIIILLVFPSTWTRLIKELATIIQSNETVKGYIFLYYLCYVILQFLVRIYLLSNTSWKSYWKGCNLSEIYIISTKLFIKVLYFGHITYARLNVMTLFSMSFVFYRISNPITAVGATLLERRNSQNDCICKLFLTLQIPALFRTRQFIGAYIIIIFVFKGNKQYSFINILCMCAQ